MATTVWPDVFRIETRSFVPHDSNDPVVVDPKLRARVVDVGMLHDVEQRLLEEAVDGHRSDERKRVGLLRPVDLDVESIRVAEVVTNPPARAGRSPSARCGGAGASHNRAHLLFGFR